MRVTQIHAHTLTHSLAHADTGPLWGPTLWRPHQTLLLKGVRPAPGRGTPPPSIPRLSVTSPVTSPTSGPAAGELSTEEGVARVRPRPQPPHLLGQLLFHTLAPVWRRLSPCGRERRKPKTNLQLLL